MKKAEATMFSRPKWSRVTFVVLLLALPACGGSSTPTTPPPPAGPVTSAIVNLLSNNTFSPSTVNLLAGGTVTFTNLGGGHNVTANDGSFRCANGCDGDGQGGNGAPATNGWSVTITFPTPGSVGYNCEVHVGLGMTGTINVQ